MVSNQCFIIVLLISKVVFVLFKYEIYLSQVSLVTDVVHVLVFLYLDLFVLRQVFLVHMIFYRRLVHIAHLHAAELLLK